MQKKKNSNLFKGFGYAWQGIAWNFKCERNMRWHLVITVLVILAGIFWQISFWEWLIICLFFALVPALELVNSAVESSCDIIRDHLKLGYSETKLPRDLAAGAVLWAAILAAIVGSLIFIPKILASL
jgi:diacylglycerol kinase (ATP)